MIEDRGFKPAGPQVIGDRIPFKLPKLPARVTTAAVLIAVAGLVVIAMFATCFSYVRPYEFGIKETKIGVHRGIQQTVYAPGWAFLMPFGLEQMHLFPRNIQTLELSGTPAEGSENGKNRFTDKAAKIQTSDGFYVDVDVTILYKIVDPYKLITTIGSGDLYRTNGIMPKAEPILKQAFGELTTEDFYNSPLRTEKAEKARDLLNAELSSKGLQVDHVLVRYFKYSDEIQKNIEAKKLQDQLVFKNQAEAKAATEEANVKRISQEGEMLVAVAMQEGEAYVTTKTAEMDLYTRQKKAEADLLVKLAEAKKSELKNKAMQVAGADKMVAMKMADVLQGLDTIIIPSGGPTGMNPLDLDQMLKLFGANSADSPPAKHAEAASKPPESPPPPPPAAPAAPPATPKEAAK